MLHQNGPHTDSTNSVLPLPLTTRSRGLSLIRDRFLCENIFLKEAKLLQLLLNTTPGIQILKLILQFEFCFACLWQRKFWKPSIFSSCIDHMRVLNFISVDFCFVQNHLRKSELISPRLQLFDYFSLSHSFVRARLLVNLLRWKNFLKSNIIIFLFKTFCYFLWIISINVWFFFELTQPKDVSRLQLTYFWLNIWFHSIDSSFWRHIAWNLWVSVD